MSMNFFGTFQGSFIQSNPAAPVFIPLRSGFSYMWVKNLTQIAAGAANQNVEFYFDPLSQTNGTGIGYEFTATGLVPNILAAGTGFFTQDQSINVIGASTALTQISGDTPPRVTTGSTAGLIAGSTVVRIYQTIGARQFEGIDFTVGTIRSGTVFDLAYGPTIVTTGATTGTYAIVPFNPIYYPRNRIISSITAQANTNLAVVQTTVTHGYVIGQKVTFRIPHVTAAAFGMTQLDGMEGTILSINTTTNTFVVDINIAGFTAFAWPLTGDPIFTPAQVTPSGANSSVINGTSPLQTVPQSPTAPAYYDAAQLGVLLMPGALSPAGQAGDQIIWVAGTSWNIG